MLTVQVLLPLFIASFAQASASPLQPRQEAEEAIMYEYGHGPSTTIDYGEDPAAAWLSAHPEIAKPSTYDWQATATQPAESSYAAPLAATDTASAPYQDPPPPPSSVATMPEVTSEAPVMGSANSTAAIPASDPSVPGSSATTASVPSASLPASSPPSEAVPPGGTATSSSAAGGYASQDPVAPVSSATSVSAQAGETNGARPSVTGEEHTATPPEQSDGCSCGYTFTDHEDRYYPEKMVIDFSTLPDGADLTQYGFYVNNGDSAGPASTTDPGRRCVGAAENVYVEGGILHLKVPAAPADAVAPTGAELIFNPDVTGGLFTMEAQVDATPGTCMSIHTYTKVEGTSDEIDIEVLGQTIFEDSPPNFKGMGLSNYESGGSKAGNHSAFPNDPTQGFNRYTIGWFDDGPQFFYNDAPTAVRPEIKIPTNKCSVIINNWTNGDPVFTQGPPTTDNILKVRKIEYYYSTGETTVYPALKDGCTVESACPVSGGAVVATR
ncbi:hypothetical protein IAU59_007281 [Kwoniella sp. CBS 9459]